MSRDQDQAVVDALVATLSNGVGDLGERCRAVLVAADLVAGIPWRQGQGPHPTGGYLARTVSGATGGAMGRVSVVHEGWVGSEGTDAGVHRGDGAARYVVEVHLAARSSALWYERGSLHREDGPASALHGRGTIFCHRGQSLLPAGTDAGDGRAVRRGQRALLETFQALVAAGATEREATTWVRVAAVVGTAEAEELAARGAPAAAVLEAAHRGVVGVTALAAVATRRAPASWATRPPAVAALTRTGR